ncbi:BMP family ABC transporter substrate-binding protein [Acuticoccus sp. MNP-M23]|uniref:BMP family ABC transporter substrate-binding protein n=1 Tax=Acuticoccus sp. MNP-M23 TaxID=3072793 RepID=UPI0028160E70|nr:BMP family ABC transporter substrate-binding protein [Acuticoccus sp. MNP-M23]WMS44638.1 BMP family ABC transporter substrate-binding protein [Acuticoccus sp. MNP-M23]
MRRLILGALVASSIAGLTGVAQAADKIGFIYVGPAADFGYNMSMDLGREFVEANVADVETTAFEAIPETAEVERVMERLINTGHNIIFATSYGYLDHAIKLGEKFPDVAFLHAGGLKTSDNVGTYWADSDAGMYLAGVTAGSVSKTGKLGFVGAFQIPQLLRSINAFTLGAQSVNPDATTTVIWTGGWWEPQKEAEAVNAFADEGIDVIAEQVDSPITIAQTALKRDVHVIGKDVDISDRAGDAWLTGVSWNWGPMMVEMVEQIRAGTWTPSHVRGDLGTGSAVLDPFGPAVPAATADEVMGLKADILSGDKAVFAGPIVAQDGTVVVPEGDTMSMEAIETMDFLVEGVIGSAS